jgi:hypothetical protein
MSDKISSDQILQLVWREFNRLRQQNCKGCLSSEHFFDAYYHTCVGPFGIETLSTFQQAALNLEEPYKTLAKEFEHILLRDFFRRPRHFSSIDSDNW